MNAASKTLLIVQHSRTGGTLQMARALADGARQAGADEPDATDPGVTVDVQILLRHATEVDPAQMLAADAYVFATPENLAAMSGLMKDFFDRCYYPLLDHIQGRPYVSLICAGSDGRNAARQIERICTGWRLRAVAEPLIVVTGAQTPAQIQAAATIDAGALMRCHELGLTLASAMALGIY
jgi:multimeric flavodoxin WrbA